MKKALKKSLAKGKAPLAVFKKDEILVFDKKGKLRVRFGVPEK